MSENTKKKLKAEELEGIAGGMIYHNEDLSDPLRDPNRTWEVINNNNGKVMGQFMTQGEACEFAGHFGKDSYNKMIITKEILDNLRKFPHST